MGVNSAAVGLGISRGHNPTGLRPSPLDHPDPSHRITSLLNLVAAWLYAGPARTWWLFAAASALFVIIVTFAYFVPVLLRLPDAAKMPEQQLTRMVRLWVRAELARFVILVAA